MISPRISIIMPVHNQNRYIADAIQSVIHQTYIEWELIIVDDGSTDSTADIIAQFDDPRIRYIYQTNQGASEARNTGIRASSGQYLAFLDADDLYHPKKLQAQIDHLELDHDIGLSYVAHIDIDQDSNPLNLFRSSPKIFLKSLVLGFPFGTNDILLRRCYIKKIGYFKESLVINEDRELYIRLALAGCQFAGLPQFLSYRRLYADRAFSDLPAKMDDMLRALGTAYNDPRCPSDVLAIKYLAYRNIYLAWAYQAAVQNETNLARTYFRKAIGFESTIIGDNSQEIINYLAHTSTRTGGDHETRLCKVFSSLPSEIASPGKQYEWAVGRGFLLRGVRSIMWGRIGEGNAHFKKAASLNSQIDNDFSEEITYRLINYEVGFGKGSVEDVLENLSASLEEAGYRRSAHRLRGCYAVNKAFQDYHLGQYKEVIQNTLQAIKYNPTYLFNRGVLSILFHSLINSVKNNGKP